MQQASTPSSVALQATTGDGSETGSSVQFVINLCASTAPLAVPRADHPQLRGYTFFVSRRREDGRERFRLHLGYFASQEAAESMLEAVRDHYLATGHRVGVKAAGGIRTAKQALAYLVMVKETLGDDWLTPELFRFGASTLVNDVLMQIRKQKTGSYQSGDYFTLD